MQQMGRVIKMTPASKTKKRVLVMVGTRPEAVKLAPVIETLQNDERYECVTCATGQHTDMMFPILDWFGVKRDFTLHGIMMAKQPLSHLAGKLLQGLHDVVEEVHPDVVVVQGDTTSAFIGALATFYGYDHFWKNQLRSSPIEVAHIEAGLRTGHNYSPYPEEVNRKLIGHMANWNFAPTALSAEALYNENITENVYITGNTVIDALFETERLLEKNPRDPIAHIPKDEKVILVTGHRRENYGDGLHDICVALKDLAARYPKSHLVYPVHLNRHVQGPVHEMLGGIDNIHLLEPLQYPDFVALMQRSHIILTDSGGVQEEGPSLGKPVLVMRDLTERPEAIAAGTAKIVGTSADKIVSETAALMDSEAAWQKMANAVNPYGDGLASQRIANLMMGESAEVNAFNYQEKVA